MLGFDPDRIVALARSLRAVLDEHLAIRLDDPLTADASAHLARCNDLLAPINGRLLEITSSRVLDQWRTPPTGLGRRADLDALLLAEVAGWAVVDDTVQGGPLLGDAEFVALVARLPADRMSALLDELAVERRSLVQGTSTNWSSSVAAIDHVIGLVARALGPLRDGTCSTSEAILTGAPLDVAGVLIASLDTDVATFTRLAVDLLTRWYERPHDTSDGSSWPLDSPANHLFGHAALDADRSRSLLDALMTSPHGLHLLTDTGTDPVASTSVVAAATDPVGCDAATAGRYVLPYVRFVFDEIGSPRVPYDPGHVDLLGVVAAPWLLQFTSRAADWGVEQVEAARELGRIVHDAEAMAVLVTQRSRILDGLAVDLADPAAAMDALRDISGMLGWLNEFVHEEQVADELADRFWWDVTWDVVGQIASLGVRSTGLGGTGGKVGNAVVGLSLDRVRAEAEARGWGPAPRPADLVVAEGARSHDASRTLFAAATAGAMVDALRDGGRAVSTPPAPDLDAVCPSLTWLEQMDAWLGTVDEPERSAIRSAVDIVLNPGQASEACENLLD